MLQGLQDRNELAYIQELCERFAPRPTLMLDVQVVLPDASVYNALLEAA